jgi:hypothetical protein
MRVAVFSKTSAASPRIKKKPSPGHNRGRSASIPASHPTVKLEGSARVRERAVLLYGSCDQQVIGRIHDIPAQVSEVVRGLVCRDASPRTIA